MKTGLLFLLLPLLASALPLALAPSVAAQVHFHDLSPEAAVKRARAEGRPVTVFFASATCNKSTYLRDVVFADPVYADAIGKAYLAMEVDADQPAARRYYEAYDLWGQADPSSNLLPVPRLLFLDLDDQKIGMETGVKVRVATGEKSRSSRGSENPTFLTPTRWSCPFSPTRRRRRGDLTPLPYEPRDRRHSFPSALPRRRPGGGSPGRPRAGRRRHPRPRGEDGGGDRRRALD